MIKHGSKAIYVAGFLFSINAALTSYVSSSFLGTFIPVDYIGVVYAIAAIVALIGIIRMPRLLARIGNRKASLLFSGLCLLSLLMLAFAHHEAFAVFAFILYFSSSLFFIVSIDIFIEEYSSFKNIGTIRGFYLTITNVAWVLAQAFSGSIIDKSSYAGIYLFGAGIMALVCSTIILFFGTFKDPSYKKVSLKKAIQFFTGDKNMLRIYGINLLLKFFYAWMVIYTPIYLHMYLGFDWAKIGLIFMIMLLPFVILDLPLGRLADKIGEKKMLIVGFSIAALCTSLMAVASSPRFIVWALILFGTRVGAATIEAMSEIYFFKKVTAEKSDEIYLFRSTDPISYLCAPLLAVAILLYLPAFKLIFCVLGAILLLGVFISFRLKDIR